MIRVWNLLYKISAWEKEAHLKKIFSAKAKKKDLVQILQNNLTVQAVCV